ncbi:unnamed protein product, partial [Ascophyllum nodosum]
NPPSEALTESTLDRPERGGNRRRRRQALDTICAFQNVESTPWRESSSQDPFA